MFCPLELAAEQTRNTSLSENAEPNGEGHGG